MRLGFSCALLTIVPLFAQRFPADSHALVQTDDRELIETVCPGRSEHGGKVKCGPYCPPPTGFGEFHDNFGWELTKITRGHFLSGSSEDAVISAEGCEPHSENFGGSVLLTRRDGGWRMLWYKAGVDLSKCHKVRLQSDRELLACIGEYGVQGIVVTELYVEDMLKPSGSLMAGDPGGFFSIEDNTVACGSNFEDQGHPLPVSRAVIRDVRFNFASALPEVSVTFDFGRTQMTVAQVQACLDAQNPKRPGSIRWTPPAAARYTATFSLNGTDFKPAAASAALAKRLGLTWR